MSQQEGVPKELLRRIKLHLAAEGIIDPEEVHRVVGGENHIQTEHFDGRLPEERERVAAKIRGLSEKPRSTSQSRITSLTSGLAASA